MVICLFIVEALKDWRFIEEVPKVTWGFTDIMMLILVLRQPPLACESANLTLD